MTRLRTQLLRSFQTFVGHPSLKELLTTLSLLVVAVNGSRSLPSLDPRIPEFDDHLFVIDMFTWG